ncbi:unnamed protein product [Rhizophagus irregularis]|nr:unnamed protein product [Rhizophagus irregularis]
MNEAGSIFLQLSNKIDSLESKNEDASRSLIYNYFDFWEAIFKQYKELKPEHGKEKIARINSTPPDFILNLTKDEKDYVMAEILKQRVLI